jgi:hypothetical protein
MSRRGADSTPPLDFSDRIRDLTQVFVGREWLLREVDDFVAQDKERYLVITGEPGIGKSAVAARLTQVRDIHAYLCWLLSPSARVWQADVTCQEFERTYYSAMTTMTASYRLDNFIESTCDFCKGMFV